MVEQTREGNIMQPMPPTVATIGFFDGVHRGHRYLLQQVQQVAKEHSMRSLVITFDRHPRLVLSATQAPKLLTTLSEKVHLLRQSGCNAVEVLLFDETLSRLSAFDFMRDVLSQRLGVRVLVMGYDHRFGHGGGTFDEYMKWGKLAGIDVVQARELPGTQISSSRVRKAVSAGDVDQARQLMGHPFTLTGEVVHGHEVGRTIGFPTLNLRLDAEKLLPASGVYAVVAVLDDGTCYKGMLCVGSRPTLADGRALSIEAHLFDFDGDLYGQHVTLQLIHFLRHEICFPSLEDLRAQLQRDKAATLQRLHTCPDC